MSRIFTILILLSVITTGCSSELNKKFKELDRVITEQDRYNAKLENEADSLHNIMDKAVTDSVKWECSDKLFKLFKYWQADSALTYLDRMDALAGEDSAKILHVKLERSIVEVLLRRYQEAESMLKSIDTSALTQKEMAAYYKADLYLDGIMAVDEMIPADERKEIVEKRHWKRLSYINNPEIEPFELIRRNGMQLYESGHAKEAIVILHKLVDETTDIQEKSEATYTLAFAYAFTGYREKENTGLHRALSTAWKHRSARPWHFSNCPTCCSRTISSGMPPDTAK